MITVPLPVMIRTRMIHERGITIYYPEIFGIQNIFIQQAMNQKIFDLVQTLINEQHIQQGFDVFAEMIGTFEIKTNERSILSLSLSNYAIANHAAHGLTIMKSLTFNIETGKSYSLGDLFKSDSNYVEVLSAMIEKQIKQRDIQLLEPFTGIKPNQDYYIADKSLVIYFQLYEITPYYVGFPMFPISVFKIQNIILENGPLDIMATNS